MKTILSLAFVTSIGFIFSSCTTVEDRREPSVRSSTTTTEQSAVRRSFTPVTETTSTTQSY